jgi:hypothetical protein
MTVPTEPEKFTLGTDRMFTFVNDWRICVRCSFEMFTEPVEVADALDADPLVLLEPLFESAAVPPLESPLLESAAVPPLESPLFESAAAPLPCRAPPAEPPVAALPEPLPWVLVAAPPPVPPAVLDVPPVPLAKLPATVNAKAVAATVLNKAIRILISWRVRGDTVATVKPNAGTLDEVPQYGLPEQQTIAPRWTAKRPGGESRAVSPCKEPREGSCGSLPSHGV